MRTSGRARKKPKRYAADGDDGGVGRDRIGRVEWVDASTTTDFIDAGETQTTQTTRTTQTRENVVIRARDDDERREREIERLAETETRLTRELIDALARASEHCAALARSELGRARAERDRVKMLAANI